MIATKEMLQAISALADLKYPDSPEAARFWREGYTDIIEKNPEIFPSVEEELAWLVKQIFIYQSFN